MFYIVYGLIEELPSSTPGGAGKGTTLPMMGV